MWPHSESRAGKISEREALEQETQGAAFQTVRGSQAAPWGSRGAGKACCCSCGTVATAPENDRSLASQRLHRDAPTPLKGPWNKLVLSKMMGTCLEGPSPTSPQVDGQVTHAQYHTLVKAKGLCYSKSKDWVAILESSFPLAGKET